MEVVHPQQLVPCAGEDCGVLYANGLATPAAVATSETCETSRLKPRGSGRWANLPPELRAIKERWLGASNDGIGNVVKTSVGKTDNGGNVAVDVTLNEGRSIGAAEIGTRSTSPDSLERSRGGRLDAKELQSPPDERYNCKSINDITARQRIGDEKGYIHERSSDENEARDGVQHTSKEGAETRQMPTGEIRQRLAPAFGGDVADVGDNRKLEKASCQLRALESQLLRNHDGCEVDSSFRAFAPNPSKWKELPNAASSSLETKTEQSSMTMLSSVGLSPTVGNRSRRVEKPRSVSSENLQKRQTDELVQRRLHRGLDTAGGRVASLKATGCDLSRDNAIQSGLILPPRARYCKALSIETRADGERVRSRCLGNRIGSEAGKKQILVDTGQRRQMDDPAERMGKATALRSAPESANGANPVKFVAEDNPNVENCCNHEGKVQELMESEEEETAIVARKMETGSGIQEAELIHELRDSTTENRKCRRGAATAKRDPDVAEVLRSVKEARGIERPKETSKSGPPELFDSLDLSISFSQNIEIQNTQEVSDKGKMCLAECTGRRSAASGVARPKDLTPPAKNDMFLLLESQDDLTWGRDVLKIASNVNRDTEGRDVANSEHQNQRSRISQPRENRGPQPSGSKGFVAAKDCRSSLLPAFPHSPTGGKAAVNTASTHVIQRGRPIQSDVVETDRLPPERGFVQSPSKGVPSKSNRTHVGNSKETPAETAKISKLRAPGWGRGTQVTSIEPAAAASTVTAKPSEVLPILGSAAAVLMSADGRATTCFLPPHLLTPVTEACTVDEGSTCYDTPETSGRPTPPSHVSSARTLQRVKSTSNTTSMSCNRNLRGCANNSVNDPQTPKRDGGYAENPSGVLDGSGMRRKSRYPAAGGSGSGYGTGEVDDTSGRNNTRRARAKRDDGQGAHSALRQSRRESRCPYVRNESPGLEVSPAFLSPYPAERDRVGSLRSITSTEKSTRSGDGEHGYVAVMGRRARSAARHDAVCRMAAVERARDNARPSTPIAGRARWGKGRETILESERRKLLHRRAVYAEELQKKVKENALALAAVRKRERISAETQNTCTPRTPVVNNYEVEHAASEARSQGRQQYGAAHRLLHKKMKSTDLHAVPLRTVAVSGGSEAKELIAEGNDMIKRGGSILQECGPRGRRDYRDNVLSNMHTPSGLSGPRLDGEEYDEEHLMASIARLDTLLRGRRMDSGNASASPQGRVRRVHPSAAVPLRSNLCTTSARGEDARPPNGSENREIESSAYGPERSVRTQEKERQSPAAGMTTRSRRRRAEPNTGELPRVTSLKASQAAIESSSRGRPVASLAGETGQESWTTKPNVIAPGTTVVHIPAGSRCGAIFPPTIQEVSLGEHQSAGAGMRYCHAASVAMVSLDNHRGSTRSGIEGKDGQVDHNCNMTDSRDSATTSDSQPLSHDRARDVFSAGIKARRPNADRAPASAPSSPRGTARKEGSRSPSVGERVEIHGHHQHQRRAHSRHHRRYDTVNTTSRNSYRRTQQGTSAWPSPANFEDRFRDCDRHTGYCNDRSTRKILASYCIDDALHHDRSTDKAAEEAGRYWANSTCHLMTSPAKGLTNASAASAKEPLGFPHLPYTSQQDMSHGYHTQARGRERYHGQYEYNFSGCTLMQKDRHPTTRFGDQVPHYAQEFPPDARIRDDIQEKHLDGRTLHERRSSNQEAER